MTSPRLRHARNGERTSQILCGSFALSAQETSWRAWHNTHGQTSPPLSHTSPTTLHLPLERHDSRALKMIIVPYYYNDNRNRIVQFQITWWTNANRNIGWHTRSWTIFNCKNTHLALTQVNKIYTLMYMFITKFYLPNFVSLSQILNF